MVLTDSMPSIFIKKCAFSAQVQNLGMAFFRFPEIKRYRTIMKGVHKIERMIRMLVQKKCYCSKQETQYGTTKRKINFINLLVNIGATVFFKGKIMNRK